MSLFSSAKITFLIGGIVSAILTIMPEFVPDKWKTDLKIMLGDKYALIWVLLFTVLSITLLILAWYESKKSNSSTTGNSVKIKGNRNKTTQIKGGSTTPNEMTIDGDDNENNQS
jgi:hypothetical protein